LDVNLILEAYDKAASRFFHALFQILRATPTPTFMLIILSGGIVKSEALQGLRPSLISCSLCSGLSHRLQYLHQTIE
jgi:hypothetical protein